MKLDAVTQGYIYELASKLGIIRALLFAFKKGKVYSSIKGLREKLGILDNLGREILSDNAFLNHKPIIKGFILQSVLSFLEDFEAINWDISGFPTIKTLYWDDFGSSLEPAGKTVLYKGKERKICDVAREIMASMLPKNSVINLSKGVYRQGDVEKTDFLLDMSVNGENILYVIDFKNGATHLPTSTDLSSAVMDIYASRLSALKTDTVFDVVNLDGVEERDTGKIIESNFGKVKDYFHYLKFLDKYSEKFIQASAYAKDYINRMEKRGVKYKWVYIKPQVNAVNRVARLKPEELTRLYSLADKRDVPTFKEFLLDYFGDKLPSDLTKAFIKGTDVDETVFSVKEDRERKIIHVKERLIGEKDYSILNQNLRKEHTKEVINLLNRGENVLLTGNPGIGKTYAVIQYVSKNVNNALCLYASPRIAVNFDFADKVVHNEAIKDPYAVVLTTNSRKTNRKTEKDNRSISFVDIYCGEKMREIGVIEALNRKAKEKLSRIEFLDVEKLMQDSEDPADTDTSKVFTVGVKSSDGVYYQEISDSSSKVTVNDAVLSAVRMVHECLREMHVEREKIYVIATIQALSHKTHNFLTELGDVTEEIGRGVFFIDEITGDPNGLGVAVNFIEKFGNRRDVSLVIGDASLNSAIVSKHIIEKASRNRVSDSTIIVSKEKPVRGVRVLENINGEPFTIGKGKFSVIEVNSFPSSVLNIEYLFAPVVSAQKEKTVLITEKALELVKNKEKPVVYVQSKAVLDSIRDKIEKTVDPSRIIIIYSSLSDKDKMEMINKIDKGDYEIALITSSSARGLSYPYTDTILIDFQSFEVESGLMEAVQTAFRARGEPNGDIKESREKKIIFTIVKPPIDENVENRTVTARRRAVDTLLIFTLIRNSILSRIGVSSLNSSIVPLGYFTEKKNTTDENIFHLVAELQDIAKRERQASKFDGIINLVGKIIEYISNEVNVDIDRIQNELYRICSLLPPDRVDDLSFLDQAVKGINNLNMQRINIKEINGFAVLPTKKKSSNILVNTQDEQERNKEKMRKIEKLKSYIYRMYKKKQINETDYDTMKNTLNMILSVLKREGKENIKAIDTRESTSMRKVYIAYPFFSIFATGQKITVRDDSREIDLPSLIDSVFRGTLFTVENNTLNISLFLPKNMSEIELKSMRKLQIREFSIADISMAYRKRKTSDYVGKIFTLMEM